MVRNVLFLVVIAGLILLCFSLCFKVADSMNGYSNNTQLTAIKQNAVLNLSQHYS